MALIDDIQRMRELDTLMKELDDVRKPLQEEYDQLRLHKIPNAMAEQDTTSVKGAFGRCTLTSDLTLKTPDKEKLHEWLTESGFGDLIVTVPTVNPMTLKAFVKEQMKEGTVIPEDVVLISPFSRAVLYKS